MAINFKTSSHIASILTHAARTVRNGSTLKSAREYMHYQLITRVEAGQVEGVDVGHCAGAYALQAVLRSKADFLAHCDREAAYWNDLSTLAIAAQRAAKAARESAPAPNTASNTLQAMADRRNAPTVITSPGEYVTRNGTRVTIDYIDNGSAPYTFPCKGSAWKMFRGAMRPRGYTVWMKTGHLNAVGDHPLDIVGPWEIDSTKC